MSLNYSTFFILFFCLAFLGAVHLPNHDKKNTFGHFRCFSDIVGLYIIDGKIIGKLMLKENETNRFYYYGVGDSMETTRDLKNIYIYKNFDCDINSGSGHVYNIINRKEYKLEIENRWSKNCKLVESGD